ncbi:Gamma-glutamyltranspeptidase precursor [Streptomyces sp. YIM 130001]|uniref:gamma-glutamyltransferase n=1 Tax=Streptomyces sp. YIM 130001 TaxID=2259644 RepID=UPI000E64D636|nr:gamma-glutamyltransferase [Streptomyces sp. YIM 130001]RII15684.1 Gamma-glutamyltranspeptidase precursor [Streptomyces sp. YIM 130001]
MSLTRRRARAAVATASCAVALTLVPAYGNAASPAGSDTSPTDRPDKQPVAVGTGGAVASLDAYATEAGLKILREGGNAVDAAVAVSAALGVVRPYDGSIGGGGVMMLQDGRTGKVSSINSRETAGSQVTPEHFVDPETGEPLPFEEARRSGLSVGVPGTVAGWEMALKRYGTMGLGQVLKPATSIAEKGFVVDAEYESRTESNAEYLNAFPSSRDTWLVDGESPKEGSVFRNPDIAKTYRLLARDGADAFYEGKLAKAIARTVTDPEDSGDSPTEVRPGKMTTADIASYRAQELAPTHSDYKGYDLYGMAGPTSGGTTVGEILNILERKDLSGLSEDEVLHEVIEASALSYADREAYLGDPDHVDVPVRGLLSDGFAAERAALVTDEASEKPVASGDPWPYDDGEGVALDMAANSPAGGQTTHLTVADDDGNIVSFTFTIEGISGSGMTVPGYGFLLNNELTDFSFDPQHPANAPDGGKRPRSSMSPTLVFKDGKPHTALGTPGGSRIITTVMQVLLNHLELGKTLPEAIAAPRISQRNESATELEAGLYDSPTADALRARGHKLVEGDPMNNVTGVSFLPDGGFLAAAEPERYGGGAAAVVDPAEGAASR